MKNHLGKNKDKKCLENTGENKVCECKVCYSTYETTPFKDSFICEDCKSYVKNNL